MLYFIIAFALIFGTIMGLRASYTATAEGETIADARFHGLLGGTLCAIFGATVLFALWGLGTLYWTLATLPGAY